MHASNPPTFPGELSGSARLRTTPLSTASLLPPPTDHYGGGNGAPSSKDERGPNSPLYFESPSGPESPRLPFSRPPLLFSPPPTEHSVGVTERSPPPPSNNGTQPVVPELPETPKIPASFRPTLRSTAYLSSLRRIIPEGATERSPPIERQNAARSSSAPARFR